MLPQLKILHSRRFLLIYLAVVVLLLLLMAERLAVDKTPSASFPGPRTFQPPVALPQLLIQTPGGDIRSNVHLQQHWTYLVLTDPDCQQYCDAPFQVLDAVASSLGHNAPQIQALTLDMALCPPADLPVFCGMIDKQQRRNLLKTAAMAADAPARHYSNSILLVNPDARLQHRYQLPLDSAYLIKDFIAQRRQYAESNSGQRP